MKAASVRNLIVSLAAFVLVLPLALALAEEAKDPKAKPAKIMGVYSKVDLTEEQKQKIVSIQNETNEKIKALRAEEAVSILGVLTPEQRAKIEAIRAEEKAAKEAKDKERAEKAGDKQEGGDDKD